MTWRPTERMRLQAVMSYLDRPSYGPVIEPCNGPFLEDLNDGACRFIRGYDRRERAVYCGCATDRLPPRLRRNDKIFNSFCPEHRAVVYEPSTEVDMKSFTPNSQESDAWIALAELAQQIAYGRSTAYRELGKRAERLKSAMVLGENTAENPCNRLRKLCQRAALHLQPDSLHASMALQASAVRSAFARLGDAA
jgi:hypothetical protein